MISTKGYAAVSAKEPLQPFQFDRRDPRPNDVVIDILFSGICHSDIHSARSEWGQNQYPLVPGHEMAGRVSQVGSKVKKFKVGDSAGVGCFIDSCRSCPACKRGEQNYCEKKVHFTYADVEKDGKTPTYGGYSTQIVVDQNYVLKIPKGAPLERVAPLLCAGITTYSPLRHWKVGKGHRVAVLGLGGLGHMAVKIAAALGAEVTVLSSSPSKKDDAKRLGAKHFVLTSSKPEMETLTRRFDFVLNTVSAIHDLAPIFNTLKLNGVMILVGVSPEKLPIGPFSLIERRRTLAGSLIGGIPETQEMLNFCVKKKALADVEVIPASKINEAYERVIKQDVRYRFVIDASTF